MPKQSYYIVALPGDGIGPEVLSCALKVLDTAGQVFQINFQVEEIPCGGHYYAEHEIEWPDGSFEKCEAADAVFRAPAGVAQPAVADAARRIGAWLDMGFLRNVRGWDSAAACGENGEFHTCVVRVDELVGSDPGEELIKSAPWAGNNLR